MASRRPIVAMLVLLVLTLLAYAPVLRGGFVWGDLPRLERHAGMGSGDSWKALWTLPSRPADPLDAAPYAPVADSLLHLEHQWFGEAAWAYHIVSVGLHCLTAWMLWLVLRRLGFQWGALLGAALFAVHPLNTETVTWISQQGEILALVFVLLAALCWVRWMGLRAAALNPGRSPLGTAAAYVACLLFAVLAFLSSPIAIPLPLALLFTAWVRHGAVSRRTLLASLPFVLMGLAYAAWSLSRSHGGDQVLHASTGVLELLRRLVLPVGLSWIYPQRDVGPATWACWGAIVGGLSIAFAIQRNARGMLIGGLFFILGLLLTVMVLSPAELQFAGIADHLGYFASIGILAAIAAGVAYWIRKHPAQATPILSLALLVVAFLTFTTARRAWVFADAERLYRDTLEKNPQAATAAESLGDLLLARHDNLEAAKLYRMAMEAEPSRTSAARAYATLLASEGKSRQAQEVLQKVLEMRPTDPLVNEALADLVVASIGPDAYPHVMRYYQQAVAGAPERALPAKHLATIYTAQSRVADAAAVLEKTLPFNPRDISLRLQLATLLVQLKKYDDADRQFDVACALDPKNAAARAQWGEMLLEAGRPREAETQFRRALAIEPQQAMHHVRLGRAMRDQIKMSSALDEFEAAQDLDEKFALPFLESAQTYLALRDEEKAEQYLQAGLRVDPASTVVQVALGRLYLTSTDLQRRNIYRGITLLRQAVEGTHGEDLSVLVAYGLALGSAHEYDQALEVLDQAIALGKRLRLSGEQSELLLRSKEQLEVASAPSSEARTHGGDSRISLMGTGMAEDREQPLPTPRQRPMGDWITKPLDLSVPPSPDERWIPPPASASPFGAGPIVLPPDSATPLPSPSRPASTQPKRTGSAR